MLCCVFWLVSPKCLGGKFVCRVNVSALASTWMVRYAISSTPFRWHVQCDCSALLSVVMWHWHLLWFGSLLGLPPPFVMMQRPWLAWQSDVVVLNFSYWSEFVFAWGSRLSFSWSSCLSLHGRVSFVAFVVVTFVFTWSRSRICSSFCGRHVCLRMVAESNGCSELVA